MNKVKIQVGFFFFKKRETEIQSSWEAMSVRCHCSAPGPRGAGLGDGAEAAPSVPSLLRFTVYGGEPIPHPWDR